MDRQGASKAIAIEVAIHRDGDPPAGSDSPGDPGEEGSPALVGRSFAGRSVLGTSIDPPSVAAVGGIRQDQVDAGELTLGCRFSFDRERVGASDSVGRSCAPGKAFQRAGVSKSFVESRVSGHLSLLLKRVDSPMQCLRHVEEIEVAGRNGEGDRIGVAAEQLGDRRSERDLQHGEHDPIAAAGVENGHRSGRGGQFEIASEQDRDGVRRQARDILPPS